MTAPPAVALATTTLRASGDARAGLYALITLGTLGAAVLVGQPALVALAVPFALALALGLRRTGPVDVRARVVLDVDRVLEGDPVGGCLALEWADALDAELTLHRLRGVTATGEGVPFRAAPNVRRLELPIELRAERWGRHTPFEVWVRLEVPFGLLSWTGRVAEVPVLRVLPERERLDRLLDPTESRTVLGAHPSRRIGAGGEFAELRPYAAGDRLRDLNWSATARRGQPFVNRYNPEMSGDVVIAVDAFADGSVASTEALARAARAAWAVADLHLAANDRAGLAGIGGRVEWLPPGAGRLARYRLLEALLRIGGEAGDPVRSRLAYHPAVPASALVVALTSLREPVTVATLLSWWARGRAVAAVFIDPRDLLEEPASETEDLARRLWSLELDRRRRMLTGMGIPVIAAGPGSIAPVISALRRVQRRPATRRGR
jgi:uncharacterized protein (DUF58 family)